MRIYANLVQVPIGRNPNQGAAVKGTIIGAIAGVVLDDSHKGAAVGAGVGTLIGALIESDGHRKAKQAARDEAEEIAHQDAITEASYSDYKRAFSACLEGRSYVVR